MRLYAAFKAPIRVETAEVHSNVDDHIQNFHLGRYIVGYTVGNLVLRRRAIYTSPNKIFEYIYPLNVYS